MCLLYRLACRVEGSTWSVGLRKHCAGEPYVRRNARLIVLVKYHWNDEIE
jgi:hypothetical protein